MLCHVTSCYVIDVIRRLALCRLPSCDVISSLLVVCWVLARLAQGVRAVVFRRLASFGWGLDALGHSARGA